MSEIVAVILAAGASTRMGAQKLRMDFRGRPLIEWALESASPFPCVLVAGPAVAEYAQGRDLQIVHADHPELGMAHSLKLAHGAIDPRSSLLLFLADKPLVNARTVAAVVAATSGHAVVYPSHRGRPGHPVYFSPAARALINALPDGDSIRSLRDDPSLAAHVVAVDDPGTLLDIDTPEDLLR